MTTCIYNSRVRRQVDRLLITGLPRRRHQRLRDHLRGCDSCSSYYEAARRSEESLFPLSPLSPAGLERVYALVRDEPPPSRPRVWGFSAMIATAAVLAVVAVVPLLSTVDQFGVKGSGAAVIDKAGLSVFWVQPGIGKVEALTPKPSGVAVFHGDVLQMAYSNQNHGHGVVVGVDQNYQLQWYHPKAGGSIALRHDVHDEPFGGAFEVVAPPGPLRLYAIFDDEPLSPGDIERAVENMRAEGTSIVIDHRLPGIKASQDSLLLSVKAAR